VAVYSVDKLIAEARKLASDYRRATGKALPGVSVEIAEYDAARLLHLELVKKPCEGGYDAIGKGMREGKRVQIKGRTIYDEQKKGQRIGQLKLDQEWDSVVLVLMDEDHEPYEIYEAERSRLEKDIEQAGGSKRSKRGIMSVSKFKNLGRLVWTREEGEIDDDEVWDSQASS
jgi:hypothetical protein